MIRSREISNEELTKLLRQYLPAARNAKRIVEILCGPEGQIDIVIETDDSPFGVCATSPEFLN
jgi:hypothetical protein